MAEKKKHLLGRPQCNYEVGKLLFGRMKKMKGEWDSPLET